MREAAGETSGETLSGGCMCGAVRYRASGEPLWVVNCHCSDCRRACGMPFATWIGFRAEQVSFEDEIDRRRHASSPSVARTFCAVCGTPLTYESDRFAGELHIMAGTLDDPARVKPTHHIYTDEAVPWALPDDGLERRRGGPSEKRTSGAS